MILYCLTSIHIYINSYLYQIKFHDITLYYILLYWIKNQFISCYIMFLHNISKPYHTILYYMASCCIILYHVSLHILYYTILYYLNFKSNLVILYYIVLYFVIVNHITSYYTIFCCSTLYQIKSKHIILSYII